MPAKIDKTDVSIITELANDASISIPDLAKKINIKQSMIYSRINRLLKKKIIKYYTIVVNTQELGYNVKALTGLKMNTKKRDYVIEELFKIGEVCGIAEVTGRFDIIVTTYSKTLDDLHKLTSEEFGRIDGILSSESFIEMNGITKAIPRLMGKL